MLQDFYNKDSFSQRVFFKKICIRQVLHISISIVFDPDPARSCWSSASYNIWLGTICVYRFTQTSTSLVSKAAWLLLKLCRYPEPYTWVLLSRVIWIKIISPKAGLLFIIGFQHFPSLLEHVVSLTKLFPMLPSYIMVNGGECKIIAWYVNEDHVLEGWTSCVFVSDLLKAYYFFL